MSRFYVLFGSRGFVQVCRLMVLNIMCCFEKLKQQKKTRQLLTVIEKLTFYRLTVHCPSIHLSREFFSQSVPSATFPKAKPNPVPLMKHPRTHLLSADKIFLLTLWPLRVTRIFFLLTVILLNHSIRSWEYRKWSPT